MIINGFDKSKPAENLVQYALSAGRFPQASIIEGGTPEERNELADKIAAALVCSDRDMRPCGECSDCRKAADGMHPDISIYNPSKSETSSKLIYSVKAVKEIRKSAFIIPNEADARVVIFRDAQCMNEQGQNALLKILEEPPEYAVFILLAPSKSVFSETVLSRAMVYTVGGKATDGSDDIPQEQAVEAARGIADALLADNEFEIVKAAGAFDKNGKLLEAALPHMSEIFMNALKIKYGVAVDKDETAAAISIKLTRRALINMIDSVNILNNTFGYNANLNLTLARLCTLLKSARMEKE